VLRPRGRAARLRGVPRGPRGLLPGFGQAVWDIPRGPRGRLPGFGQAVWDSPRSYHQIRASVPKRADTHGDGYPVLAKRFGTSRSATTKSRHLSPGRRSWARNPRRSRCHAHPPHGARKYRLSCLFSIVYSRSPRSKKRKKWDKFDKSGTSIKLNWSDPPGVIPLLFQQLSTSRPGPKHGQSQPKPPKTPQKI